MPTVVLVCRSHTSITHCSARSWRGAQWALPQPCVCTPQRRPTRSASGATRTYISVILRQPSKARKLALSPSQKLMPAQTRPPSGRFKFGDLCCKVLARRRNAGISNVHVPKILRGYGTPMWDALWNTEYSESDQSQIDVPKTVVCGTPRSYQDSYRSVAAIVRLRPFAMGQIRSSHRRLNSGTGDPNCEICK